MKYSLCLAALAACATEVVAFPAGMFNTPMSAEEKRAIAGIAATIESDAKERRQIVTPIFDASSQHVSIAGKYAYVAPTSSDQRGPCPGLNAMANHGYIPHNGIATISQFVQGTYDVFGMGTDLAAFLSIYGAVFDGDLTSWSIGGPVASGLLDPIVDNIELLSTPQGISGSHNKYECDVSPTRGDLYEYGNDYKLVLSQFEQLYALPLGPNGYDLTVLTPFRATRFNQSIMNNPYFFNAPFSGVVVQPAAYTFIYRFMANKSSEYPEGYLNGNVLKSFFGITGKPGSFVYNQGQEKIPANFYKRAIGDEYTIPYFATDVIAAGLQHFEFVDIGGNTGKVNTFTGLDIYNLTGGVYNARTLLQGNNAACLGFEFAQQAAPDILKGLYSDINAPLGQLNVVLNGVLTNLSCPQLTSIDTSQFAEFPGSNGTF